MNTKQTQGQVLNDEINKLDTFLEGLDDEGVLALAFYLVEAGTKCVNSAWIENSIYQFLMKKPQYHSLLVGLEYREIKTPLSTTTKFNHNKMVSSSVKRLISFPRKKILEDRKAENFVVGSTAYLRKKYKHEKRIQHNLLNSTEAFKGLQRDNLKNQIYVRYTHEFDQFWKADSQLEARYFVKTESMHQYSYHANMYKKTENAPVIILGVAKTEDTPYRHHIYRVAPLANLTSEFFISHKFLKKVR